MKARVRSTGDIFEVSDTTTIYPEHYDMSYNITEVEFLDVKEESIPKVVPDYWTRLEHQYAGMAMQTMLATLYNSKFCVGAFEAYANVDSKEIARLSKVYAHALVEKMKEEK